MLLSLVAPCDFRVACGINKQLRRQQLEVKLLTKYSEERDKVDADRGACIDDGDNLHIPWLLFPDDAIIKRRCRQSGTGGSWGVLLASQRGAHQVSPCSREQAATTHQRRRSG